jgi:hypothetical protein
MNQVVKEAIKILCMTTIFNIYNCFMLSWVWYLLTNMLQKVIPGSYEKLNDINAGQH